MSKEKKPLKSEIRSLRRSVDYAALKEEDAPSDPFILFEQWLKTAIDREAIEPNAMTLATASKDGSPTVRTVLLRDYSPEGFIFYTNYTSRKGQQLEANPFASLLFYWRGLSRQVLIDGRVVKIARQASIEYFRSRPRKSQVAAYVSEQSRKVQSRAALESKMKEVEQQFKGRQVPCPDDWGGYIVIPERIEFWQGHPDRVHDRLCYNKNSAEMWERIRLAP